MSHSSLPIAIGFMVAVLAACTPALSPPATIAPAPTAIPTVQMVEPAAGRGGTPVKIQVSGTVAEGPLYLATERGYFAEQGIAPQFITFDGAQQAIPALSTGQIDVGAGGLSAGLFNAINRGIGIRVVAPQSQNHGCDHSSNWVLVRKDLADSGAVRTPADLRGLRIAVNGYSSVSGYQMNVLLHQANLQSSDVQFVEMAFGDMGAAFGGRTIDIALGAEPTATNFVDKGLATKWLCGADIIPDLQVTYLLYSPQFADQHADLAQRWMNAYAHAARDWRSMLETGQDKEPTLSVLGKYTQVKDLALIERITLPVPAVEVPIDVPNITGEMSRSPRLTSRPG